MSGDIDIVEAPETPLDPVPEHLPSCGTEHRGCDPQCPVRWCDEGARHTEELWKGRRRQWVFALERYANPESYHALLIVPDRPAGWFADDFSEDHGSDDYARPMPGAWARRVIRLMGRWHGVIEDDE